MLVWVSSVNRNIIKRYHFLTVITLIGNPSFFKKKNTFRCYLCYRFLSDCLLFHQHWHLWWQDFRYSSHISWRILSVMHLHMSWSVVRCPRTVWVQTEITNPQRLRINRWPFTNLDMNGLNKYETLTACKVTRNHIKVCKGIKPCKVVESTNRIVPNAILNTAPQRRELTRLSQYNLLSRSVAVVLNCIQN